VAKDKPPQKPSAKKHEVSQLTHTEDKRKNIPTAEYRAVVEDATKHVIPVTVKRHDPDMAPQLVRRSEDDRKAEDIQPDLFADFNGIGEAEKTEFYFSMVNHQQGRKGWKSRIRPHCRQGHQPPGRRGDEGY